MVDNMDHSMQDSHLESSSISSICLIACLEIICIIVANKQSLKEIKLKFI